MAQNPTKVVINVEFIGVNWRQLCELKEYEGMGFHCPAKFNLALFAKQG